MTRPSTAEAGVSAGVTENTVKELRDIAQLAVEIARRAGADDAEVMVRDSSELIAKVRLGEPELVQEAGSRSLGLRVLRGGRRAVTYTSDLRREALEALCAETVTLADFAKPDEYALPPDPSLLAKSVPELDLYDPAVAEVDAAWALKQAIAGEAAARKHDPRVTNSEGASWSHALSALAFATSGGFVGGYRGSYASLVVAPLADDTSDPSSPKKRNGYWWTASRFLGELDPAEAVGIEAARRTVATIGSRKVETQECAVVFDPEVARGIVGMLFAVANGAAFWRKSSYLVGKEGEVVASPLVTVVDDP
ncbi:MAG: TldD/PmbA family protein, partial [Deltaproteobacteria bacterium]